LASILLAPPMAATAEVYRDGAPRRNHAQTPGSTGQELI
jgi:hypothetical protein